MENQGTSIIAKTCCSCKESFDAFHFNKGSSRCKPCQADYKRQYYEANRDRVRAKHTEYRAINAERIKQQKKQYRDENKEKVAEQKRASRDRNRESERTRKRTWARKKYDPIKDFNAHKLVFKNVIKELLLHTTAKECNGCNKTYKLEAFVSQVDGSETQHCHFCRVRKKQAESQAYNTKRHQLLRNLKKHLRLGKCCVDCGVGDRRILEFDHIDPNAKKRNVSACTTVAAMTEEAAKCELRCVCCHRLKTFENGKAKNRKYDQLNGIKIACGSCQICSREVRPDNVVMFDFDHIDRSTKEMSVSQMVGNGQPTSRIATEIAKTRLLCSNCHRLHTLKSMYNNDGFYDN